MATKMVVSVLGSALLGLVAWTQDPPPVLPATPAAPSAPVPQEPSARPAPPPADAKPLRPIEEPYVEPVQRGDLPERYGTRDPIEGFWRVQARSIAGKPVVAGGGYMVIGRRHMVVHFESPGARADVPLLRADVFTWARVDNGGQVRLTTVMGHFNDVDGDVLLDKSGEVQLRSFELRSDTLRVNQEAGSWVDFVRVE